MRSLRAIIALAALLAADVALGLRWNVRNLPPGALHRPPPKRAPKAAGTEYVLVMFGDSYSDTGRTLKASGLPQPDVYWKGRYTNGPNWFDYLQQTLEAKYKTRVFNYAYGGATACRNADMEAAFPYVKPLPNQTDMFLADLKAGAAPRAGPGVRVVPMQWLGGNDIEFVIRAAGMTGVAPTPDDMMKLIAATVKCRIESTLALALSGAVYDIALFPAGPIWMMPRVPVPFKAMVQTLMGLMDAAFVAAVGQAQAQLDALPPGAPGAGVRLHTIGTSAQWMADAFMGTQPPANETTKSCFEESSTFVPDPTLKSRVCTDPEDYAFYDSIHATTRYMAWFTAHGVLPRLQQAGLLPEGL
ncbi:hypothetical protein HYH03_014892 [Edaphochlamys debaryana]|uniref:Uncharacterized protein n=1 Tax=Edaphochlamys debaryana TaxID=47281 RepID=A0A836BRR1_9CHLO|nr:hypothetical protein HYH03_014892 [Edaphochlamys debaryana]|eukprot:KAG2486445.1 hypothetical protein HYH03_014892 [Edaphochlamys debaryana]